MDARQVTREIRRVVRPTLEAAGFSRFTGRNAWRELDDQTWVVSFGSFSAHTADGVGCTTASFAVRLGIVLADELLPPSVDPAKPPEEVSSFRFTLLKRIEQPWFHPWGQATATDRRDVFFVREDGSDLAEVVAAARDGIERSGLPRLAATSDPLMAYCELFDYRRSFPPPTIDDIEVWPSGTADSPFWRELVMLLGRRLERDVDADIANGLPDRLLFDVLGR